MCLRPSPGSALGRWGAYVARDGVVPSGQEEGNLCLPSHWRLCDPRLGDSLDWLTSAHVPLTSCLWSQTPSLPDPLPGQTHGAPGHKRPRPLRPPTPLPWHCLVASCVCAFALCHGELPQEHAHTLPSSSVSRSPHTAPAHSRCSSQQIAVNERVGKRRGGCGSRHRWSQGKAWQRLGAHPPRWKDGQREGTDRPFPGRCYVGSSRTRDLARGPKRDSVRAEFLEKEAR